MTNTCFIVASTYNRVHLLNKCVRHFLASRYAECDLFLYFQGDNFSEVENQDAFKEVVIDSNLRGIFTPRYELLKRFGKDYDYCVIIDDDLFIQKDTDYDRAMRFCRKVENVGCVVLTNWKQSVRNEIERIDYPGYYNVMGGMVIPRRSAKIILNYFADKEQDYTEDMVWLLLWVKGLDLYIDHGSFAVHMCNSKSKTGEFTGYSVVRMTQKYLPILSEWFYDAIKPDPDDQSRFPSPIFGIKSLRYARPDAFEERKKCREWRLNNGGNTKA